MTFNPLPAFTVGGIQGGVALDFGEGFALHVRPTYWDMCQANDAMRIVCA